MHLPGHLRDRFCEAVEEAFESGQFPATIGCMQHYRTRKLSARQFLRLFAGCEDIVPKATREELGELYFHEFGADLKPQHLMTYRNAARRLDELRLGMSELALW